MFLSPAAGLRPAGVLHFQAEPASAPKATTLKRGESLLLAPLGQHSRPALLKIPLARSVAWLACVVSISFLFARISCPFAFLAYVRGLVCRLILL